VVKLPMIASPVRCQPARPRNTLSTARAPCYHDCQRFYNAISLMRNPCCQSLPHGAARCRRRNRSARRSNPVLREVDVVVWAAAPGSRRPSRRPAGAKVPGAPRLTGEDLCATYRSGSAGRNPFHRSGREIFKPTDPARPVTSLLSNTPRQPPPQKPRHTPRRCSTMANGRAPPPKASSTATSRSCSI